MANYISRTPAQNATFKQDYDALVAANPGALLDMRMDQAQVLVNGRQAGKNRPDFQYTLNGQRCYWEYDTVSSDRALEHYLRINVNDPDAIIVLKTAP